jgi:hypothetical protein
MPVSEPPAPAPAPAAAPAAAAPSTTWSPPASSSAAAARPTGITILAVLAALGAIGALFAGFAVFAIGSLLFGLPGAIFGLAWLALAGLGIAAAVGFWQMQPWAWPLGVALEGFNIIYAVVLGFFTSAGIGSAIIPVVIGGAILYYRRSRRSSGARREPHAGG